MNKVKSLFNSALNSLLNFFRGAPAGVASAANSRQARYGGVSLVSLIAMIGILVLLNLILKNAGLRWDLTKNKLYSLSPETLKVVKDVKQDIKAKVFISSDPQTAGQKNEIKKLLDEYATRNPKITYDFVDPYSQQQLALRYGIQRQGTVVFTQGDRVEQTTNATEQDFTAAIIKLKNPKKVNVVFWTGNGEKDPEKSDETAYSEIKSTLERLNYVVSTQDVSKDAKVASDTAVLVIAGPRVPYVSKYADALSQYLARGGRVLVMFETLQNFQKTGLEDLLSKYGISIKQGAVLDPKLYFDNPSIPGIAAYPNHQITQALGRTVYINPILVSPAKSVPSNLDVESIAKTSNESWLETSMDQNPQLNPTAGDVAGPIDIAVAMKFKDVTKDPATSARIVALGDSDSGSNLVVQYSPQKQFVVPGNLDLIVNSINWLSSRENLISITPKDTTQPTLSLSAQQLRQLQYLVLLIMPGIFLVLAIIVWRGRKKLKS